LKYVVPKVSHRFRSALLVFFFLVAGLARAETPPDVKAALPPGVDAPQKAVSDAEHPSTDVEKEERKTGIAKLVQKLTKKDGTPARIGVFRPLDYTTLKFEDIAQKTILASFERYGKFDMHPVEDSPKSLTLEEFRRLMIKYRLDILVVSVLNPTNFDLFVYDRRTPYAIYAHSEVVPPEIQYRLDGPTVEEFVKADVRRCLYAYMQNQYYELPREEIRPLLTREVPRWIASLENYKMVNREILSRFYGSISVGAAVLVGSNGNSWNSNLVGLQFGARVLGDLYLEAALDLFSYNAAILSAKYMFTSKDNPFRFSLGLGAAQAINQHTLNWDQTYSQGSTGQYVVGSGALMFPIVDVYFKVESRTYVGLGGAPTIFSVMPGIFLMF
jgi:hypothetical protein